MNVQKPGIKKIIHKDLALIKRLLKFAKLLSFSEVNTELVNVLSVSTDEFFKWIEHELDYRLEILNITRIKNNFSEVKFFKAPEVAHALSGQFILTMEYIEGVSLNNLFDDIPDLGNTENIKYKDINCNKRVFIKQMLDIIFKQVFQDGYFHADPHPANILLTHENRIAFIDFGVIGILPLHLKETLMNILSGILDHDIKMVSQYLIELNEIDSKPNIPEMEKGISVLLNDWQTGSVIEMSTAEVFYHLLIIAQKSDIQVPVSVFVLGKTVLEYDGLLQKLDPEMDILNSLKPYMEGGSILDLKNIPLTIQGLLDHPEDLPEDVLKFAKQLAGEGVKFLSRLADQSSIQK